MSNKILDGIMGLAVADALGVPVEFRDRQSLKQNPVIGMRAYGTYNQPAGTWSDDTSMTLCLVESLTKGLDYKDIMDNFIKWYDNGEFTPHGIAFDIGIGTSMALSRYKEGIPPLKCGGKGGYDNGNGSLMRILPILFYLQSVYGTESYEKDDAFDVIHNVSSLTHGHKRSLMACGLYITVASKLMGEADLDTAVGYGVHKAMEYYKKKKEFQSELKYFERLMDARFKDLSEEKIKSSGYVVDTLEAAIWCLLNTVDYRTCVLKAVNLGGDTDTVGAVTGGLAGLRYGYGSITKEWKDTIVKKDYIENLCDGLYESLSDKKTKS